MGRASTYINRPGNGRREQERKAVYKRRWRYTQYTVHGHIYAPTARAGRGNTARSHTHRAHAQYSNERRRMSAGAKSLAVSYLCGVRAPRRRLCVSRGVVLCARAAGVSGGSAYGRERELPKRAQAQAQRASVTRRGAGALGSAANPYALRIALRSSVSLVCAIYRNVYLGEYIA